MQECEKEAKSTEARLTAQLDMQHTQINDLRNELLHESGAFNRERAAADSKMRSLEQELANCKHSLQVVR